MSSGIDVWSAGIETHGLNPFAVKAMKEVGIDITSHTSTNVKDLLDVDFDLVVTVCDHARESCPLFPRARRQIHQAFDDPPYLARNAKTEEEAMLHYRRVRDEIKAFVETLPERLQKSELGG